MIRTDLASLRRFWDKGTRELRFVLDLDDDTDLEADGGEELLRQISLEISQDLAASNPATVEQWLLTTEGWSASMFEISSLDDAEEWLEQLAGRLDSTDQTVGTIRGGPRSVKRPAWARDGRASLTAYLYCTTVDLRAIPATDRGPVWGVDRALTVHLADQLLLWAHGNRATEDLTRDGNWTVHTLGLDHALTMAEAIERRSGVYVRSFRRDPHHRRSTTMSSKGQLIAQTQDDASWPERLAAVREILTLTPSRSDYGYIRWADGGALIPDYGETWPHLDQYDLRANRPMLTSFVPDAFAVQLLTDAHLERAHDLTEWDITPLAGGRHLVQAKDLDPWFDPIPNRTDREYWLHDAPPHDKSIIEKARADFGGMILTPELIQEHNPWR